MKTFYNKIMMKLLRLLPALIFIMLALSYNVRAQEVDPNPVCYGQDINLKCTGFPGCGVVGATYTWLDKNSIVIYNAVYPASGNFTVTRYIMPGGTVPNPEYYGDMESGGLYFLKIKYPVGLMNGTSVTVYLEPEIFVTPSVTPITCHNGADGAISISASGGSPFSG